MSRKKIDEWITEDGLLQITGWIRDGLTIEDVAHNCGVNKSTFYDWKKKHPELEDAIKKGAAPVDLIVENAMFKRATGYKTIERRKIKLPDGTTRVEVVEKEVPPDTTAGIFWLANRKPQRWKRKQVEETKPEEIEDETRTEVETFLAAAEIASETTVEDFLKNGDNNEGRTESPQE